MKHETPAGSLQEVPTPSVQNAMFRSQGDFWRVGYKSQACLLKDAKGFGYLAHLLRHPFTEFHSLDLVAGVARNPPNVPESRDRSTAPSSLGDAGEVIDEQARGGLSASPSRAPGDDGASRGRSGTSNRPRARARDCRPHPRAVTRGGAPRTESPRRLGVGTGPPERD
jgi:hypothetical protein